MTPITWLFCFAVLWSIAVDIQAHKVKPLVMAVYVQEDERKEAIKLDPRSKNDHTRKITLTDAEKNNIDSLTLPLDNIRPKYIALLCVRTKEESEEHRFIVKQVTDKIDSIDENITCEHLSKPNVSAITNFSSEPNFYDIGFEFRVTEDILFQIMRLMDEEPKMKTNTATGISAITNIFQSNSQQAAGIEAFTLLHKFTNEFYIKSETDYGTGKYLQIRYNFFHFIPASIAHTVKAHMHSYTYEEECKEINTRKEGIAEEIRNDEELVDQFKAKEDPSDHQWRQLVPMQDFKGIYTTQATCIYLNYVRLHKFAINALKDIEIAIRMVADVINEVHVITGTYIKKDDNSHPNTEKKESTIPTIVWKKISYFQNGEEYGIVAIIHNEETERVCSEENQWDWPEDKENQEKTAIGVTYYCSMEYNLSKTLGFHLQRYTDYPSFNLRDVAYKKKKINVWQKIKDNFSSAKIEKESLGNRITNWLL